MSTMSNEAQARMQDDDESFIAWAEAHALELEEQAYQEWASDQRADGEDDTREAWNAWCEWLAGHAEVEDW